MSEQETNNIPSPEELANSVPVPEFLRADRWFDADVAPYVLDFAKAYEPPKYTLTWKGIGFAPLGGIHAITGQAGNGKTMTLAQFMTAILHGTCGSLAYNLGEECPTPRVLYVDTEMEEANTVAVKNRVMSMCGRDVTKNYDDFVVVMLREVPESVDMGRDKNGRPFTQRVPAAVMRWRMVLKSIWEYKPTVAFIDGLLDVVSDFNSNEECQELIYKCMQVASHYGISLWCVVHQNPGGEKLVGHLGSFLERKVTDIFQTKKEKQQGEATFTVIQKKNRGRDVEDWKFRVLPIDGWGVPEQLDAAPAPMPVPVNTKEEADALFKSYPHWSNKGVTYTALHDHFVKPTFMSTRKFDKLRDVAFEAGILFKDDNGKYHYHGLGSQPQDDSEQMIIGTTPLENAPF